jgi:hypothetical protein
VSEQKLWGMQKKISHSDISLYTMPIYNSKSKMCKVCERKMTNHTKMIVFGETFIPVGFSCSHCRSIYVNDDVLVEVGSPDGGEVYGET